jgi:glycerophosphoryl diester phosphodiesterase
MGVKIIKGDKKINLIEIKRNINYFSWICSFFIIAIGIFFAWKFINVQEYFLSAISFLISVLIAIPVKRITFNIGIKRAKKRNKNFLRDLAIVKVNKKRFFTISGLTISATLILFILFTLILIPNIDVIKAEQIIFGAHRGNSVDYIENTLPAFEDAIKNDKYQFIEFDIQYTQDKEMVVFHDYTLLRLQGKLKFINELNYTELLEISDYYIPLYSEVMDLIAGIKPLNIEIKSQGNFSDDKIMADFIINDCKKRGIFNGTLFSSVSSEVIDYISKTYPDSSTGKIYFVTASTFLNFDSFTSQIYQEIEEINADYLMLHTSNLGNYNSLKNLKAKNKTIIFWYVTQDQMYVIEPNQKSWVFKIGRKEMSYSPLKSCIWWC